MVEEARETGNPELDLVDMKIESLEQIPNLRELSVAIGPSADDAASLV